MEDLVRSYPSPLAVQWSKQRKHRQPHQAPQPLPSELRAQRLELAFGKAVAEAFEDRLDLAIEPLALGRIEARIGGRPKLVVGSPQRLLPHPRPAPPPPPPPPRPAPTTPVRAPSNPLAARLPPARPPPARPAVPPPGSRRPLPSVPVPAARAPRPRQHRLPARNSAGC